MSTIRRRLSAAQKVEILREYLENQTPISELAERYNVHPGNIQRWKKDLFEGAIETFTQKRTGKANPWDLKIDRLQRKIKDKDEVISEIVADNIQMKNKLNGES